jgi:hypothetical protein
MKVIWHVEQICWDSKGNGEMTALVVEAPSCAEAAKAAGECDGVHEIRRITWLGPVVARVESEEAEREEA